MTNKYGLHGKKCGIYMIKNMITGDFYIGASKNIASRFSNHLNRDCRKYYWRTFYKDIGIYGKINFECIVLEECSPDKLLEREQYYYDTLKPAYNIIRPCKNMFSNQLVRKLAHSGERYYMSIENRKQKYNTDEYKKLFSKIQDTRKKQVEMYKDNIKICEFESFCDAGRYITTHTEFKGKNKASKIKEVCDGKRPSAYGYIFKYKL